MEEKLIKRKITQRFQANHLLIAIYKIAYFYTRYKKNNTTLMSETMKANPILIILLGLITLVGISCKKEEGIKPVSTSATGLKSEEIKYTLLDVATNNWCKRPGRNCLPETTVKPPKPLKLANGDPDAVAAFFFDDNKSEWSVYFPILSSDPVALEKLQSRKYALETLQDPATPGRVIYSFHSIETTDYFGIPVINI
jgi:hypothetical protein